MPGLEQTTAMLARLRRQGEAFAKTQDDGVAGRMSHTPRFGPNPGALRMLSYVPNDLKPGAPLVVVLHGCTQRAEPHAAAGGWLTLADRYGFAVIAPEQTPGNNPNRCFNWYEAGDQVRGGGEAASIRAMVDHAVRTHGLDAQRVFVTGLSAGGAMTCVMLATYPEVFAGGGVVAGLPFGVADTLQAALGAMMGGDRRSAADLGDRVKRAAPRGGRVPRLSIWHGDADGTVKPSNATEIAKQWASAHGLPARPSATEALSGRTRSVWRSPETGEVLIEANLLKGFGHATPLATRGADGVGAAAPYMLEAGVSSSLEIARFWGIADESTRRKTPARQAQAQAQAPRAESSRSFAPPPRADDAHAQEPAGGVGDQVMAAVSPHVPAGVQDVIAKALKSAGLMR